MEPRLPIDSDAKGGNEVADNSKSGGDESVRPDLYKELEVKRDRYDRDRIKAVLTEISHDLRTPLNTIIGFAQMIEEELLGPIGTPKYREYASIIGKSGKTILEQFDEQVSRERLSGLQNVKNYEHIIELSPDMICICRDGVVEKMNAAGVAILGMWDTDTIVGRRLIEFVHDDYQTLFDDTWDDIIAESKGVPMKLIRGDGRHVEVHVNALHYTGEGYRDDPAVILTARDVTERQRAMKKIVDHDEQLRKIMATVVDGIVMVDSAGNIDTINAAGERIFGYNSGELIGSNFVPMLGLPPSESVLGQSLGTTISDVVDRIHDDKNIERRTGTTRELEGVRKDGITFPLEISINETQVGGRQIYIGSFRDISDRQERDHQLRLLATRDPLTGLPNRYQFELDMEEAIKEVSMFGGWFSVMNIDLNSFKTINDALGHVFGDKVIEAVGVRLYECLSETGIVAHLGSDDFFVLVTGNPDRASLEKLATYICDEISKPLLVDQKEIFTTCTIGVCLYPDNAKDRVEIMQHSDTAVHHAKLTDPGGFLFYADHLGVQANRELEIERNLRRALDRDEFKLLYQPKVDLQSRQVTGCEALLRWESAELGFVPPDEFIIIAERSGLIIEIGQWVLDEACRQGKAWSDAGLPPIHIAVNVSAVQFLQGHIEQQFADAIERSGFQANLLDIELTESMLAQNAEHTIETLLDMKNQGMTVSMDDFGTGYSSLSYLAKFPLDNLKVDRSFVMHLPEDRDAATLVRTIVTMAQQLGLSVVAEGIETASQESFLSALGCEMGQGYLFGKPLPPDELASLLVTGLES